MALSLKKNKELEICKFKMACDGRPDIDKTLPWNFFWGIVGAPASGKTNMWLNLITRRKKFFWRQFDKIFIFSPSLKTINKDLKLPEENLIDGFDQSRLDEIIKEQEGTDEHTLIILDDVVAHLKANMDELIKIIYNRRHIGSGMSVIIISQKYNKIPLDLRVAMSDIVIYNKGKKELDTLFDEYVNLDRKEFDKLIRFVFDEKYSFLYIKTNEPEQSKYYKRFDKICFGNESMNEAKETKKRMRKH